jgi:hypothetical protein
MSALSDVLAHAKRPERRVPVCLRGDLIAEIEALNDELLNFRTGLNNQATLASKGDERKVAQRIQELQEEMRQATIEFRLQGLNRSEWAALVADHPPTQEQAREGYVYNIETLPADLIRRCLMDPTPTDEEWAQLLDNITSGQFEGLAEVATTVSRTKVVDVPFSLAASATLQTSGETSE